MSSDDKTPDFCARVERLLRESPLAEIGEDLKNNVRALGTVLLGKMDVVSRDEFERQNEILAAATARLAEIQKKLEETAPSDAEKTTKSTPADS